MEGMVALVEAARFFLIDTKNINLGVDEQSIALSLGTNVQRLR